MKKLKVTFLEKEDLDLSFVDTLSSPIGTIVIHASESCVSRIKVTDKIPEKIQSNSVIENCKSQLLEYFEGERKIFDLPLKVSGTKFQCQVWKSLLNIPYAETRSYQDIAIAIGNEKSQRAVGGANNRNQLQIVIPCHRVIGKNGGLTGYASGKGAKSYLLELEISNGLT